MMLAEAMRVPRLPRLLRVVRAYGLGWGYCRPPNFSGSFAWSVLTVWVGVRPLNFSGSFAWFVLRVRVKVRSPD